MPRSVGGLVALGLALALASLAPGTGLALGKDPGAYCYDNCSGHGRCVSNVCACDAGWHGENCATRFGLPPLSVGAVNVTGVEHMNRIALTHEAVAFGLSAASCAKCGLAEDEYSRANFSSVYFARVDTAKHPEIMMALGLDPSLTLPQLVFSFNKGRSRRLYRGQHSAGALSKFCQDKGAPPGWTRWPADGAAPANDGATVAVAFFKPTKSGKVDEDTDEWEEFVATAEKLRNRHDIYVYLALIDPQRKESRPEWWPNRNVKLPAWGLLASASSRMDWRYLTMTERPPALGSRERPSFEDWIATMSVAEAARLSVESFAAMEELGLPMLMVFASNEQAVEPLLPAFRAAAREFQGKITFLYDPAGEFASQKHILGLVGSESVSMAINTKDVGPVPFRGTITPESIRAFCFDFLSGRARPLSSSMPVAPESESSSDDEPDEPGVRERFKPEDVGIVDATGNWASVALDEIQDVVVFVYRGKNCLPCKQLAPYYKKVARRFNDLKQTSTPHHVVCARLDLDRYRPHDLPADLAVPAIILLPAFQKNPPFQTFSAIAKVFTIMEWIRSNAGRPFKWGEELPQFTPEEKVLFKEQIKIREERKAAKQEL